MTFHQSDQGILVFLQDRILDVTAEGGTWQADLQKTGHVGGRKTLKKLSWRSCSCACFNLNHRILRYSQDSGRLGYSPGLFFSFSPAKALKREHKPTFLDLGIFEQNTRAVFRYRYENDTLYIGSIDIYRLVAFPIYRCISPVVWLLFTEHAHDTVTL